MAGKDCTRAIAKWSIKEEDLNNQNLVISKIKIHLIAHFKTFLNIE